MESSSSDQTSVAPSSDSTKSVSVASRVRRRVASSPKHSSGKGLSTYVSTVSVSSSPTVRVNPLTTSASSASSAVGGSAISGNASIPGPPSIAPWIESDSPSRKSFGSIESIGSSNTSTRRSLSPSSMSTPSSVSVGSISSCSATRSVVRRAKPRGSSPPGSSSAKSRGSSVSSSPLQLVTSTTATSQSLSPRASSSYSGKAFARWAVITLTRQTPDTKSEASHGSAGGATGEAVASAPGVAGSTVASCARAEKTPTRDVRTRTTAIRAVARRRCRNRVIGELLQNKVVSRAGTG